MPASRKKVVVITGATGGLGQALAQEFLRQEWRVIAGSKARSDFPAHDDLSIVPLDVTDAPQVQQQFADIISGHGRIDCLVNNAGLTDHAPSWQVSTNDWDSVIAVNLKGAFLCSRAAARPMAEQRDGHIINISSYAGRAGARGQAGYAAAKAGLLGLTQSLARELGSRNVRVNAILPGVLPTRMTARLTPEQLERCAEANTLGRINALDEVARFIAFLTSTRNISGQLFQLDSRIAPWT